MLELLLALTRTPSALGNCLCNDLLRALPRMCEVSVSTGCGCVHFVFLLEHLVVRQQRVRDFAAVLSDPRVCASNSAFTANLVLVFKRMLLAVTGALSHRPSELPEMNENTPERQLQKFVGIVKKVAPWWQWGAPDELLSADDVPADAKCTFNGKRDRRVPEAAHGTFVSREACWNTKACARRAW